MRGPRLSQVCVHAGGPVMVKYERGRLFAEGTTRKNTRRHSSQRSAHGVQQRRQTIPAAFRQASVGMKRDCGTGLVSYPAESPCSWEYRWHSELTYAACRPSSAYPETGMYGFYMAEGSRESTPRSHQSTSIWLPKVSDPIVTRSAWIEDKDIRFLGTAPWSSKVMNLTQRKTRMSLV